MRRIRRDKVNERAVRILLECILVVFCYVFRHGRPVSELGDKVETTRV